MSAPDYLLAIDQGTTSTRAILFDPAGGIHHTARVALRQIYPQPGLGRARSGRNLAGRRRDLPRGDRRRAGPPDRRDRHHQPARNHGAVGPRLPAARYTTRSSGRTGAPRHCARAGARRGSAERVASRTGLVIDPYFSASKIRWLLDNVAGLRERAEAGEIAFGTIDSFLLWRLTGGKLHATDVTNASRTMLFDLHRLAWDDELLREFDIPRALLPEIRDTDADFGATLPELFGDAIPITGVAGDQQAALIGQACFSPGMVKSTYGTGAFALLHTGATTGRLAQPAADDPRLPARRRDGLCAGREHLYRRGRGAMAARPAARRQCGCRDRSPRRGRRSAAARLFRAGISRDLARRIGKRERGER